MDLVRAATLTNYEEVARDCGLDPAELLHRAGINPAQLADPEQRLPLEAAATLLEDSAEQSNCEHFGLLLAEQRPYSALGALSLLLIHLATLRDVIDAITEYQRLFAEWLFVSIEDFDETALVHVEIVTDSRVGMRQMVNWLMLATSRTLSAVSPDGWRPESANFVEAAPADRGAHQRLFPCPVEFESNFTGFTCAATILEQPIPRADATMASHARHYLDGLRRPADAVAVGERIRRALYLLLPMGRGTLDQVGALLRTHPRTIQRMLDRDGLSFATLLNDVRRELAIRHLRSTALPLGSIAHLLGYATASSFARWFNEEFGCAPSAWRAEGRSAPPEGALRIFGRREPESSAG